ncbi:hypothetical protein [Pseudoalteromonas shioyasakiensis]|uniref:hypothetical protein n=1 Tax=Pseudoalteromonas shioyasakiensis TaxID=1190813 RepID=UPI0032C0DADE
MELNAAIEAAKPANRGTVAYEVRTLESQTHDATEEIQSKFNLLLSGSRQESGLIVESVYIVGTTQEQSTVL